jgi:hypothetical protein
MSKPNKILITGTGRCGTTFLMRLFAHLEMPNGVNADSSERGVFGNCNSGLELDVHLTNVARSPYILKCPSYIDKLHEAVQKVEIDWLILPIREYQEAAQSRADHGRAAGGYLRGSNMQSELSGAYKAIAHGIRVMTQYDIPFILLDFGRMVSDHRYLYNKLEPIMKKYAIDGKTFETAWIAASAKSKKNTRSK